MLIVDYNPPAQHAFGGGGQATILGHKVTLIVIDHI